MSRRTYASRISAIIAAFAASWAVMSCGGNGASNNDQGMSVTFLGLFSSNRLATTQVGGGGGVGITPGQQGCGQLPGGIVGAYIRLGEPGPEPGGSLSASNMSGTDPAGAFVSVVGIQNNLYGQAFRAERLLLEFYVPGASTQPPSTTVPVALIAGPAESASTIQINGGGGGANGGNQNQQSNSPGIRKPIFTSLPPSFSNLCNRALSQVTIVPSSIREWLNFNRDLLPEAPYKMEVIMRISGLTSSGDRLETNDVVLDVDVLPEIFVEGPTDEGTPTPVPTGSALDTTDESEPLEQLDTTY